MSEENNVGAVLCPGCRKLISANSEECIHCGMKNPNLWGLAGALRKIIASQTSLVPIISTVCIALFVISLLLDPSSIFQMSGSFFG
ncbi:hypothetical protein MJD09_16855, partial [bacterium]|nr:hypothetical protein [bacterium]